MSTESQTAQSANQSDTSSNTVFVGRLSWGIDDARLAQEFSEVGQVHSSKVIKDRATGRSKGFGYVEFGNPEDAQKALALSGREVEGFNINVDISHPRAAPTPRTYNNDRSDRNDRGGDRNDRTSGNRARGGESAASSPPSDTVFVGNLSFDASEEDITSAFSGCGEITQIRLPRYHDSGKMKGYAYVQFSDIDGATKCVAMNGESISGRNVRLDFSKPREGRSGNGNGNGSYEARE